MNKSETIKEIATALSKAQGEFLNAKKDKINPFFEKNYAGLSSLWDACRLALSKNGLALVQGPSVNESHVTINTLLMHNSGEWIESELILNAGKPTPQSVGSAITYARRYSLAAMLGLVADDDDDGNEASKEVGKKQQEKKAVAEKNHKTTKTDPPPTTEQEREKILADIAQIMKHTRFKESQRIEAKAAIAIARTNIALEAVRASWQKKFDELAEKTTQQKNGTLKDTAKRDMIIDEIEIILKSDKFNDDDRAKVRVEISVIKSNIALEALRAVWQGKLNRLEDDFKDDDPEEAAKPNTGKKLTDEERADLEKTADQGWFTDEEKAAKETAEKKALQEPDIY